ncbi:MAG: hypothetical protein JSU98_12440 [Gemmatimonadales bacterium]|jgi:hypothetical protein|nr:MAG: hypothetical protein JSU98_12440 [Gemmatimonadales bacterium]
MDDSKTIARRLSGAAAALGVMGSLVFVAIEVQQNTEAVRGATLQAVAQQSMDLVMAGVENADLREAFSVATRGEPLSPEQERVLNWFFQAKLRADENRFRQVQIGILDESTFGQLSSNAAYRLPYFAEFWARSGPTFAEDFQRLVAREFLPLGEARPLVPMR